MLLLLLLAAIGTLAALARANVDIRRGRSRLHTRIASGANTAARPPGALISLRAGRAVAEDDFGVGVSRACGCGGEISTTWPRMAVTSPRAPR